MDELVDLPSLANKLRTQVNLISTYLYGQLSAATLTTLADYQGVGSVPLSLQQALIEDFNAIICGQSLYDAQRFIGIALRSDTQQLLAQNPQEDSLRRLLNRLLLEDAYPQEIARNHNARWAVLYQRQGTFLCAGVNPPMPGDPITWIPAYLVVIPDNDFGPDLTGTGEPVAYAQVAVRAVRRFKKHPLLSDYSKPGTISGVDCREPEPPTMEEIPSGPFCAQLASRADWYGISRFSLNWDTKPGETYRVYRALNEAVFALDRNTYSTKAHPFPSDPEGVWPNELYQAIIADSQRKSIVQSDFTMLENALSGGNGEEIRNSYRNLHADTQRLIAGQAAAESAYSLRHGNPLTPHQVPFVDEFDGRPRCHWFYRVTALSSAGVESRKTAPTPPICAPDVVPPSQPQVLMALAHEQGIRLRWLPLCEPDLAFYIIYRAADGAAALDVRTMIEVARVAKNPDATPSAGEKLPSWVTKATNGPVTEKVEVEIPRKLEYCDPAPAGREWFYRIVAEDSSGNRSAASAILKGRALRVPPAPPVWRTPQRMPDPHPTKVLLSWSVAPVPEPDPVDPTHTVLKDPRLTCMVERYGGGIDRWVPVSRWLPRGIYTFQDIPPDLSAEWSYRLRVRDHFNQNAPDLPQVTLPEVSPV